MKMKLYVPGLVCVFIYIDCISAIGWIGGDAANLHQMEHTDTDTGLEVRVTGYAVTDTCGIVTSWRLYARKNGTVIFYVIEGNTVRGSTSVTVVSDSRDNYFEIPLSSDMWISVRAGFYLGFFTEAFPMITYNTGSVASTYKTGQSLVAVGSTVATTGRTSNNDRDYAVGAYISAAHAPMFINLPYTATLYSHQTGNVLTVSVTDLDPDDLQTLTVSATSINTAYFTLDTAVRTVTDRTVTLGILSYHTRAPQNTYTITIAADDQCHGATTENVVITIINEPPKFDNLPFSTEVSEDATAAFTYTIQTTDTSDDTVTCALQSVNPTDTGSIFSVTSNEIRQKASPGFDYDAVRYYDLRIRCTDLGSNNVYSNYVFDIVKNEPPAYNAGAGYLPASIAISSTSGVNIFTASATDPGSDGLTYAIAGCDGGGSCPFSISGATITTAGALTAAYYDIQVTVADNDNTVGPYFLSVLPSESPHHDDNNAAPLISSPATQIHVMENTPVNTYLFTVTHTDSNPYNAYTYAKTAVTDTDMNSLFTFDTATQIITTGPNVLDFEGGQLSTTGLHEMTIEVNDATATATYTVTFTLENVNETPTIAIATPSITVDEGPRDIPFSNPGLTVTDPDTSDTHTWSMNCGADSKYFYLHSSRMIHLAREYDMDSGLSGSAECVVTVTDTGGLTSSGTVTLTVNNINDNIPKFPYNVYTFILSTDVTFFTLVTNLSASDADTNNFGTPGGFTYSFGTAGADTFFQIDATGVLYVRNVASFASGSKYVFEVIATDTGSSTGTCTITIVFSSVLTTTTTTTERNIVFVEDHLNPIWLLLFSMALFAAAVVIAFIVWNDRKFHEWISFKMLRLSEICRTRPREPKRSIVHPAKLTVTVNNKTLESDPDNALPWELLAKDANVPEINEVQERIQRRKELQDREYLKARPRVFEKGKGPRPASAVDRQDSDSPKYASMNKKNNEVGRESILEDEVSDDGGEDQWGNLKEKRTKYGAPQVVVTADIEQPPQGGATSVTSGFRNTPLTSAGSKRENTSSSSQHPSLSGF